MGRQVAGHERRRSARGATWSTEVRPDAVVFADGAVRPSAVTIWAAGFGVPELAARSGLRTDALGRLLTDETLTSVDDDRIVAAGDAAAPSGQPLRMSCHAAGPLGRHGRQHRAEPHRRRPARAVRPGVRRGQCSAWAAARPQCSSPARTTHPWTSTSAAASLRLIKEAVCKGTLWAIRREARKPGSAVWYKGGTRPAQAVREPEVVTQR